MASPECATAIRLVSRWGAWYTRDLPQGVAGDRRDELASDLWEHASWAHDQGVPAPRVARSIMRRAAAGALSDLGWRWRQIGGLPPREAREHRLNAAALSGVLALALATLGWATFVFARLGRGVADGSALMVSDSSLAMVAFTLLAVIGLPLLLARRTRFIGGLWLGVTTIGLVWAGFESLRYTSATASALIYNMPGWTTALAGVSAGLALLFVACALRWWPSRSTKEVAR